MNCGEFRHVADAFVDGELERSAKEKARAHMDGCVDCRRWVTVVKKATDVFKNGMVKPRAPEELKERIKSSLGEAKTKRPVGL